MTYTFNKNPESCTGYRTPESDFFFLREDIDLEMVIDFARKLERERDKAEERAKNLEEQVNIWKRSHRILVEDMDNWKQLAIAQEKQIIRLQENGPLIMVTDL